MEGIIKGQKAHQQPQIEDGEDEGEELGQDNLISL